MSDQLSKTFALNGDDSDKMLCTRFIWNWLPNKYRLNTNQSDTMLKVLICSWPCRQGSVYFAKGHTIDWTADLHTSFRKIGDRNKTNGLFEKEVIQQKHGLCYGSNNLKYIPQWFSRKIIFCYLYQIPTVYSRFFIILNLFISV